MGNVGTDAQGLERKINVTWEDIRFRSRVFDQPGLRVYGVPTGGTIVCGQLQQSRQVFDPAEANLILDDIIDSGRTRDYYAERYPDTPFDALYHQKPGDPWLVLPWEADHPKGAASGPTDAVTRLLEFVGEDPTREGLQDTPARVVKAWGEMTEGYSKNPADILSTLFSETTDELVVVRDIPFHSLCEHHVLPFTGTVSVGYLPADKVVGLSKIPRLVHCFARRLQIQERLTQEIATSMLDVLKPRFVGVIMRAHHTCMSLRGVHSHGDMVTSCLLGEYRDQLKGEFLDLCR